MPGSWRRSGILEETAPTSQCLAQDFPLPELEEESACDTLHTAAAFSEAADALADGAAAFGECFLNQLNKGGR